MSTHKAPRGLVYVLAAPDGKEYVGQTGGPMWQRLVHHRRDALRNEDRPICAAFNRYGQAAFKVTILASGISTREERVKLEAAAIAARNTIYPNGLNVLDRADTVAHLHTKEAREKAERGKRQFHIDNPDAGAQMIQAARKGFNPEQARSLCLARNADPEFNVRVAEKLHERLADPEYRAKLKAIGQSRAKVSDAEYPAIAARVANGESKVSIGRSYGVTPQCIGQVIKRNTFDLINA